MYQGLLYVIVVIDGRPLMSLRALTDVFKGVHSCPRLAQCCRDVSIPFGKFQVFSEVKVAA